MMRRGQGKRSSGELSNSALRSQARQVAEVLPDEKVDALVDAAPFADEGMRERVRGSLLARVAWMRSYGAGETDRPTILEALAQSVGLDELFEELVSTLDWQEHLHPRDQHGKFRHTIGMLHVGQRVGLGAGVEVRRNKNNTFTLHRPGQKAVRFHHGDDAARAALDASAASPSGVVGKGKSYAGYNDYLDQSGWNSQNPGEFNGETGEFNGEKQTAASLALHVKALEKRLTRATGGDSYHKPSAPTIYRRLLEARAKREQLLAAGSPSVSPKGADPDPHPPHALVLAGASATEDAKTLQDAPVGTKTGFGANTVTVLSIPLSSNGKKFEVSLLGKGEKVYYSAVDAAVALHTGQHVPTGVVPPDVPASPGPVAVPSAYGHDLKIGDQIKTNAGYSGTVQGVGNLGVSVAWYDGPGKGTTPTVSHESVADLLTGGGWEKTGAKPAKSAKKIKGWQVPPKVTNQYGTEVPASLSKLDLAPGDVVQYKKGGWKYTLVEQTPSGGWRIKGANGQVKTVGGFKAPAHVEKADGSKLALKDPSSSPAPAAVLSVAEVKAKVPTHEGALPFAQQPDGAVFVTPSGKLAILTKQNAATSGYVKAVNVETGQQFEVKETHVPKQVTVGADVQAQAGALLGKALVSGNAPKPAVASPPVVVTHADDDWKTLPSEQAVKDILAAAQVKSFDQLSYAQREAIKFYTASGYIKLNKVLRGKDDSDDATEDRLRAFDDALEHVPGTTQDVVLWRGVTGKTGERWKDKKKGAILRDLGYGSMSTSEDFAKGWGGSDGVTLKIRLPKGSRAIFVAASENALSTHGVMESEVILRRSTKWRVLESRVEGGLTVLVVEPIEDTTL